MRLLACCSVYPPCSPCLRGERSRMAPSPKLTVSHQGGTRAQVPSRSVQNSGGGGLIHAVLCITPIIDGRGAVLPAQELSQHLDGKWLSRCAMRLPSGLADTAFGFAPDVQRAACPLLTEPGIHPRQLEYSSGRGG